MTDNIIAWNFTNWITVILMVAVGYFIIGAALTFVSPGASSDASS